MKPSVVIGLSVAAVLVLLFVGFFGVVLWRKKSRGSQKRWSNIPLLRSVPTLSSFPTFANAADYTLTCKCHPCLIRGVSYVCVSTQTSPHLHWRGQPRVPVRTGKPPPQATVDRQAQVCDVYGFSSLSTGDSASQGGISTQQSRARGENHRPSVCTIRLGRGWSSD